MASMIKNYVINEFITMETGSSMESIGIHQIFAKFLPSELTVIRSIPHYSKSIYIDYAPDGSPTIIDINTASIIEMRGNYTKEMAFMNDSISNLLNQCMVDVIDEETDCLLYSLWQDYVKYRVKIRRPHENKFYNYLEQFFRDDTQYKIYEDLHIGIEDEYKRNNYLEDYQFLVTWFGIVDFPHPFRQTRYFFEFLCLSDKLTTVMFYNIF